MHLTKKYNYYIIVLQFTMGGGAKMYSGNYKIAGIVFRINSLFENIHSYCRDYISSSEDVEYEINISSEDIAYEAEMSAKTDIAEGRKPYKYSEGYLELLAVYRKLAVCVLERDVLLMHGSAISVDGEAYLFTAKSGTGKSTHTRLWRELFGERAVMVNDDKPLLHVTDQEVRIFGTPWNGKHHLGNNIDLPLRAICFLRRGKENVIREVSYGELFPTLVQQTYRPASPDALVRVMKLMDDMAKSIKFYILDCNMEPDAPIVSYEGMSGRKLELN